MAKALFRLKKAICPMELWNSGFHTKTAKLIPAKGDGIIQADQFLWSKIEKLIKFA